MDGPNSKMLSFDSEQSLGATGDALFLQMRHRILTAQYAPRQIIHASRMADIARVPEKLLCDVFQALADHGYLMLQSKDTGSVIHWTRQQLEDLLGACHDLIGLAIDKCMARIDEEGLLRLREALAFSFRDPIDPQQMESFQLRWWIFFHLIISTIEVRNFRKMMLTGMPPAIRRRVITALDPGGLRSMLSDMTALIDAFGARDVEGGRELLKRQFIQWTPQVVEANDGYNSLENDFEIDYLLGAQVNKPLFRTDGSGLPDFGQGLREPLSWLEFKALPSLE